MISLQAELSLKFCRLLILVFSCYRSSFGRFGWSLWTSSCLNLVLPLWLFIVLFQSIWEIICYWCLIVFAIVVIWSIKIAIIFWVVRNHVANQKSTRLEIFTSPLNLVALLSQYNLWRQCSCTLYKRI